MATPSIKISGTASSPSGMKYIIFKSTRDKNLSPVLVSVDDLLGTSWVTRLNKHLGAGLLHRSSIEALKKSCEAALSQPPVADVATKIGWFDQTTFVLPDRVIPKDRERPLYFAAEKAADRHDKFRRSPDGDIKGERALLELFSGNSRLLLGVSACFVGPLLPLISAESPGFLFVGAPACGKSTLLSLIGFAWGCDPDENSDRGFAESLNATDNAVEELGVLSNHTVLLDEPRSRVSGPSPIARLAFSLESGTTKRRLTETGTTSFRHATLFASNDSCLQHVVQAGIPPDESYFDRLIDVPVPVGGVGMFENLHGHDNLSGFVRRLKKLARRHHGRLGRVFLKKLVRACIRGRVKLVAKLERWRANYIANARKKLTSPRTLDRQLNKFATVYAAGRLLIEFNILRIEPIKLGRAILACQLDSTAFVDKNWNPAVVRGTPLQRLQQFTRENVASFATIMGDGAAVPALGQAAAYLREGAGSRELLVPRAQLLKIVGGAQSARNLCTQLIKAGIMMTNGGGSHKRATVKRTVNGARDYFCVFDYQRLLSA